MKIDYTVQIWREANQFIAHAMPLDVASAGPTPEKARIALDEAVGLFLATAADMGTTAEILEECGYELTEGRWHSPDWVGVELTLDEIAEVLGISPRGVDRKWRMGKAYLHVYFT